MTRLLQLARALADPTRVRILTALRGKELCVCELSDALELTQSTLSTHLQVIREAGLVRTRKSGKWVYYTPARELAPVSESIFTFFNAELGRHPRLKRDGTRVKSRLTERDGGECCRGFESECCPPGKRRKRRSQ